MFSWTIEGRYPENFNYKTEYSNSTLSGLSAKPSLELGKSLSNVGWNGHEMPPKVWFNLWPSGEPFHYKLALPRAFASDWTTMAFAICLWNFCRLNPVLLQLLTLDVPGREFRVETGILCSRKTGRTGLQVDIFRNWFHDPNLCISSYLVKH